MTWLTVTEYLCQHICVLFIVITTWSFLHLWIFFGFVTRVTRVPYVEQELLINSSGAHEFTPFLSGLRVARSLYFCIVFCRLLFIFFLFAIVLSFLRLTASDYPFSIFKLFFDHNKHRTYTTERILLSVN